MFVIRSQQKQFDEGFSRGEFADVAIVNLNPTIDKTIEQRIRIFKITGIQVSSL